MTEIETSTTTNSADIGCRHCGEPVPPNGEVAAEGFCCRGCQAAFSLINGMGLTSYYQRRCLDPEVQALKPDEGLMAVDVTAHVHSEDADHQTLYLMVEGLHCAACVWLIETLLSRQPGVISARVNMTTRRLTLKWQGEAQRAEDILEPVRQVGYRLMPYDPAALGAETHKHEKELLRAMAVAGFAAGNVMLFSVSVWSGVDMGQATRDFMHWASALITVPAVGYAIRPFAVSALKAIRGGYTNMDVPITLAVILTTLISLWELANSGLHAYFDSAISLLFFLLIGRYLDSRARGRARSAAEHLLTLGAGSVTVLEDDGQRRQVPPAQVNEGMTILLAAGERAAVDAEVISGVSDMDTSLLSGETVPVHVSEGDRVHAGTLNLSGALTLRVVAVGEGTFLAEIVRLMEVAEQGRAKYVALADRVARYYSPVVNVLGTATFLGWWLLSDVGWQLSLLYGISVLIITCPCALALAVPAVQVIATGRLTRQGILMKSATALERMAEVDTVVFDKTGTLTMGKPELDIKSARWTTDNLALAYGLALHSKHPLAQAVVRHAEQAGVSPFGKLSKITEHPGAGLSAFMPDGAEVKLGSRLFCDWQKVEQTASADENEGYAGKDGPEICLTVRGQDSQRPVTAASFHFSDNIRTDARQVVQSLKALGMDVQLLSGDRPGAVEAAAQDAGITSWRAACQPTDKTQALAALAAAGKKVLMVGDGLNDAPALAAAHVSLSPSTAVDVSQTAADGVFQGQRLGPVVETLTVAHGASRLVRQNIGLAFIYNVFTVPLAMAGYVTPLVAAIAMSASSVVVISNALRLNRLRK